MVGRSATKPAHPPEATQVRRVCGHPAGRKTKPVKGRMSCLSTNGHPQQKGTGDPTAYDFSKSITMSHDRLPNSRNSVNRTGNQSVEGAAPGRDSCEATQVVIHRNPHAVNLKEYTRFGTWNVRTMNLDWKLENLRREMRRYNVEIMGLSETH